MLAAAKGAEDAAKVERREVPNSFHGPSEQKHIAPLASFNAAIA
jgi:hypothetical protein